MGWSKDGKTFKGPGIIETYHDDGSVTGINMWTNTSTGRPVDPRKGEIFSNKGYKPPAPKESEEDKARREQERLERESRMRMAAIPETTAGRRAFLNTEVESRKDIWDD